MKTSIEKRYIWLNDQLVHLPEAKINVLSPTAQFGANVFEGIRCYWDEEKKQLYAFRIFDHYKRLHNSMKLFRMEHNYTNEKLLNAMLETIRINEYKEDIAVRQTVFIDGFGTWSSTREVGMFVAPIPKKRKITEELEMQTCCVSSWTRISDNNLSPRIKVGANYINSRVGILEAKENGYDTCIFLNEQGKVSEGPGSCLFIVRDGVLITPPLTASVLESITRDTIIELARNYLKIPVEIRDIDRTELYICDEAFLCGSAMEIGPLMQIDGYSICKLSGNITNKIHSLYLKVVTGKVQDYRDWLFPIYEV